MLAIPNKSQNVNAMFGCGRLYFSSSSLVYWVSIYSKRLLRAININTN